MEGMEKGVRDTGQPFFQQLLLEEPSTALENLDQHHTPPMPLQDSAEPLSVTPEVSKPSLMRSTLPDQHCSAGKAFASPSTAGAPVACLASVSSPKESTKDLQKSQLALATETQPKYHRGATGNQIPAEQQILEEPSVSDSHCTPMDIDSTHTRQTINELISTIVESVLSPVSQTKLQPVATQSISSPIEPKELASSAPIRTCPTPSLVTEALSTPQNSQPFSAEWQQSSQEKHPVSEKSLTFPEARRPVPTNPISNSMLPSIADVFPKPHPEISNSTTTETQSEPAELPQPVSSVTATQGHPQAPLQLHVQSHPTTESHEAPSGPIESNVTGSSKAGQLHPQPSPSQYPTPMDTEITELHPTVAESILESNVTPTIAQTHPTSTIQSHALSHFARTELHQTPNVSVGRQAQSPSPPTIQAQPQFQTHRTPIEQPLSASNEKLSISTESQLTPTTVQAQLSPLNPLPSTAVINLTSMPTPTSLHAYSHPLQPSHLQSQPTPAELHSLVPDPYPVPIALCQVPPPLPPPPPPPLQSSDDSMRQQVWDLIISTGYEKNADEAVVSRIMEMLKNGTLQSEEQLAELLGTEPVEQKTDDHNSPPPTHDPRMLASEVAQHLDERSCGQDPIGNGCSDHSDQERIVSRSDQTLQSFQSTAAGNSTTEPKGKEGIRDIIDGKDIKREPGLVDGKCPGLSPFPIGMSKIKHEPELMDIKPFGLGIIPVVKNTFGPEEILMRGKSCGQTESESGVKNAEDGVVKISTVNKERSSENRLPRDNLLNGSDEIGDKNTINDSVGVIRRSPTNTQSDKSDLNSSKSPKGNFESNCTSKKKECSENVTYHYCSVCHQIFNSHAGLQKHKETHQNDSISVNQASANDIVDSDSSLSSGKEVNELFERKDPNRTVGALTKNSTGELYSCPVCCKKFKVISIFVRHAIFHIKHKYISTEWQSLREYSCYAPALKTSTGKGDKEFECPVCSVKFRSRSLFMDHAGVDVASNPNQFCEQEFQVRMSLKKFRCSIEKKVHVCKVCHQIFYKPTLFLLHLCCHESQRHQVLNDIFSYKGSKESEINEKTNKVNPGTRLPEALNEDKKLENKCHRCDICAKTFQYRYLLLLHQCRHENRKTQLGTSSITTSTESRSQLTETNQMLQKTAEGKFAGTHCNETFPEKQAKTHPYVCQLCGVRFTFYASLQRHRRNRNIHPLSQQEQTSDLAKKFACLQCGKRFQYLYLLITHTKSHKQSDKKHTCSKCGKVFNFKSGLIRHMQSNHVCGICGKTFQHRKSVKDHMETCQSGGNKTVTPGKEHANVNKGSASSCNYVTVSKDKHSVGSGAKHMNTSIVASDNISRINLNIKKSSYKINACPICGKFFVSTIALKTHMDNCNDGNDDELSVSSNRYPSHEVDIRATKSPTGMVKKTHSGLKRKRCSTNESLSDEIPHQSFIEEHGKGDNGMIKKAVNIPTSNGQKSFRPFVCDVCHRTFTKKGNLKSHLLVHGEARPYVCQICGKAFRHKAGLKYHHKSPHSHSNTPGSNLRPYVCQICGKAFRHKASLRYHHKSPHSHSNTPGSNLRPYVCQICGKAFRHKASLRYHHKSPHSHSNTPGNNMKKPLKENTHKIFPCTYCPIKCKTKSSLETHLRVHSGPRPFGCQACGKTFKRYITLTIHKKKPYCHPERQPGHFSTSLKSTDSINTNRVATGNSPKTISEERISHTVKKNRTLSPEKNIANTSTAGNKLEMPVQKLQKPFACNHCPKRFKSRNELKVHSRVHTGARPYGCSICGESFKYPSGLWRHKHRHNHHTTKEQQRKYSTSSKSTKSRFACEHCPKVFPKKGLLKIHSSILHSGALPFACKVCHKRFRFKSLLQTHLLVHNDARHYVCSICGKTFKHKGSLLRHKRSLYCHAERDAADTTIGNTPETASKGRFSQTAKRYGKVYACPHCNEKFRLLYLFNLHARSHGKRSITGSDKVKSHACPECGKLFVYRYNMRRHLFHAHGIKIEKKLQTNLSIAT